MRARVALMLTGTQPARLFADDDQAFGAFRQVFDDRRNALQQARQAKLLAPAPELTGGGNLRGADLARLSQARASRAAADVGGQAAIEGQIAAEQRAARAQFVRQREKARRDFVAQLLKNVQAGGRLAGTLGSRALVELDREFNPKDTGTKVSDVFGFNRGDS